MNLQALSELCHDKDSSVQFFWGEREISTSIAFLYKVSDQKVKDQNLF